ncbi:MAG: N-acetylglucosamine-6-phosphate deacetylase [Candidatus Izemoplasmatales bacterium]
MRIIVANGRCVRGTDIVEADVVLEDGRIASVTKTDAEADVAIDATGLFVAPGFIDVHVHGGGGRDFMEASVEAYVAATEYHLLHGTTTIVPTAVSAAPADLERFLMGYERAEASGRIRARLGGAHLEGPYLSKVKAGAHDPQVLRDPDPAEYIPLAGRHPCFRRMTAAPELPGAFRLGDDLAARGIRVSVGHSDATAETVFEACNHGYRSVTHLYNAMSSVAERGGRKQGGVAEAALYDDRLYAEIIADLRHVPAELLKLAYKAKGRERLLLVSDCLAPAGAPSGSYRLGDPVSGTPVEVRDAAYLAGTTKLAGSVATTDVLLRNMVSIGVPLPDAVWMLTKTPAAMLGIDSEIGSLEPGMAADLVLFDAAGIVRHVVCRGNVIL